MSGDIGNVSRAHSICRSAILLTPEYSGKEVPNLGNSGRFNIIAKDFVIEDNMNKLLGT
jgi:hypothetical protein